MNQNTKEIAVTLLQEARRLVEQGGILNKYICLCISTAAHSLGHHRMGRALKDWISNAIGLGYGYPVDTWLGCQGIAYELMTTENMRLYRLRWIDEMIAQVEAGVAPLKIEGETE